MAGVNLKKSLKAIGDEAFSNCSFLEWVLIPEGDAAIVEKVSIPLEKSDLNEYKLMYDIHWYAEE